MDHKAVQQAAKDTVQMLRDNAKTGVSEIELNEMVVAHFKKLGITDHWFHGRPALLLAGAERSVLSLPASEYKPTDYRLKENDMFTVDLCPEVEGVWGDFARTIVLQDGVAVETKDIREEQLREGVEMEDRLHAFMTKHADPDMTFSQLHAKVDAFLQESGYRNLDFLGNFGHSIVSGMPVGSFKELVNDPRVFFDPGSHTKLKEVEFFTFEPHIRKVGGDYGFKREDIYQFVDGKLTIL